MPIFTVDLSIYSNDGVTILNNYMVEQGDTLTVTDTGISPGALNSEFIYSGDKKFLGFATSPNATTPTYKIGDTVIFNSNMVFYIVEEKPKEYTLRIDGVEVTDYENVVVNGVSYKCKKQEEETPTNVFYIKRVSNDIIYTFNMISLSSYWSEYSSSSVADLTDSIYIKLVGEIVYCFDVGSTVGGSILHKGPSPSDGYCYFDEGPEIGSTYYINIPHGGGSVD